METETSFCCYEIIVGTFFSSDSESLVLITESLVGFNFDSSGSNVINGEPFQCILERP